MANLGLRESDVVSSSGELNFEGFASLMLRKGPKPPDVSLYRKRIRDSVRNLDAMAVTNVRAERRDPSGRPLRAVDMTARRASAPEKYRPEVRTQKFNALEKDVCALVRDPAAIRDLWRACDFNGNGKCSLAEVDKMIVERFPLLDSKPALMRAFQRTTSRTGGGDGDDWVEKHEFRALLRNIFYFNKLWHVFSQIDSGHDRRINFGEFRASLHMLKLHLDDDEAEAEFASMDRNGGGQVLFEEFCLWVAERQSPLDPASRALKKKEKKGEGAVDERKKEAEE
jgi:Ca2+-binding EF-hand superfamily protein